MPYLPRPDTTHIKPNENHCMKSPSKNAVQQSISFGGLIALPSLWQASQLSSR